MEIYGELTKPDSPFTPGLPAPEDIFIGREAELKKMFRKSKRMQSKGIQAIRINGDRGSGKTSLGQFYASKLRADNVLTLYVSLAGCNNLEDFPRMVFEGFEKSENRKSLTDKLRKKLGEISISFNVPLFSMSFDKSSEKKQPNKDVFAFPEVLANFAINVKSDGFKGLTLILDDINGIVTDARFSSYMKGLIESMTRYGEPVPFLMTLISLPERWEAMVESQPSIARIFDFIELEPLNKKEANLLFIKAFKLARKKVEQDALDFMVVCSSGYPVLIQEIGDAIFHSCEEDVVKLDCSINGLVLAVEVVGRKYLKRQVYDAIYSKKYREILSTIAKELKSMNMNKFSDLIISRKFLLSNVGGKEHVISNFITKMLELKILRRTDIRGEYQFTNWLVFFYIIMHEGKEA